MFEEPRANVPIAERLRPRTIDEVIGQKHLLGPNKPLRVAFESGEAHSMILWGPPGVGKTTLARLMTDAFHAELIALSAVLSGVKDIREAVAQMHRARGRQTLVFVDEVHRFNKSRPVMSWLHRLTTCVVISRHRDGSPGRLARPGSFLRCREPRLSY
jgi:putative ATPase